MKKFTTAYVPLLLAAVLGSCGHQPEKAKETIVMGNGNRTEFGVIGRDSFYRYSLKKGKGREADVYNYGALLLSLTTPDRGGQPGDVTLGYDSLSGYLQK